MYQNRKFAKALAWFQLAISGLLIALIVYGYFTYRGALGQSIEAISASITTVSKVVEATAETVQMNQSLIVSTRQMIAIARGHIIDVNASASSFAVQVPLYADYFRKVSESIGQLGDSLTSVGDGLMFAAPTSIQMDGMRPIIVMSRPLEAYAQGLKTTAQTIKGISSGMPNFANQGQQRVADVVAISGQVIKHLEDAEKLLDHLNETDLPKALQEMKNTSENLRTISQQIGNSGDIGVVFFVFGLLLSGWCFLNSLSLLMLTKQFSPENTQMIIGSNE